jgi:hypothetical protein
MSYRPKLAGAYIGWSRDSSCVVPLAANSCIYRERPTVDYDSCVCVYKANKRLLEDLVSSRFIIHANMPSESAGYNPTLAAER